jgi:hypothetical protein
MKTFKYILIFILGLVSANSCLVDDATKYDMNDDGPNLVGFEQPRQTLAAIADGEEYQFQIRMKVIGPTITDIKNDITVTVGADASSSTAIEGTHFRIDNPNVVISPSNNLLGLFSITMLTEGIITPLDVSPVLVLNATAASGDPNVLNNGKPITLTLNYACPSFLEGTYDVTTEYTATNGSVSTLNWTEDITKIGIGTYRTTRVGHWTPADLGGTPGFTFTDVCGVLSVPGQYLVDYYANWVEGTDFGTVDPVTGDLYIEYSVCYGGSCRYYKSTYVKQ